MKYVPKAITRTAGRTLLKAQKNSPTLLFVAGVGGVVAATVLACRATLKVEDVITNTHDEMTNAEMLRSRNQSTEHEYNAQKRHIVLNGAFSITKLYGPALVVGVVSIGCLTKSHRQLTQRNAALTAAYVSLQNFLEGYRGRVREAIGEEKERDVYYASTPVELVEDTKDGPKKLYGSKPGQMGPYSVIWDERSSVFQDDPAYNVSLVRIQEQLLTDKLRADGYLFLNDIYKRFDIPATQTGQLCGWMIPHPTSDDFVEIKIIPMRDLNGSVALDFNVAGVVYDMLDDGKMNR